VLSKPPCSVTLMRCAVFEQLAQPFVMLLPLRLSQADARCGTLIGPRPGASMAPAFDADPQLFGPQLGGASNRQ